MSKLLHWSLLRLALLADAIASGTMGVLLATGAGPMADWLGLSPLLLRDVGVVYLFAATKFDPATPDGGKVIRGQRGEVRALACARPITGSGMGPSPHGVNVTRAHPGR